MKKLKTGGRYVVLDREFFAKARKKAWAKLSVVERKTAASNAGSAYWANMSPEQRSAEMKRRAKVRAKNRKKPQ